MQLDQKTVKVLEDDRKLVLKPEIKNICKYCKKHFDDHFTPFCSVKCAFEFDYYGKP